MGMMIQVRYRCDGSECGVSQNLVLNLLGHPIDQLPEGWEMRDDERRVRCAVCAAKEPEEDDDADNDERQERGQEDSD